MERFIDKLKQQDSIIPINASFADKKELADINNPAIVCCVTFGKELHAGHMFLLAIGEQMNKGINSSLPIILVNNNTGPRAAACLCKISETRNIALEEALQLMSDSQIDTSEIVKAYRSRADHPENLETALALLSSDDFDIFARVGTDTSKTLSKAGFNMEIIPETRLLKNSSNISRSIAPTWVGTGFMPFNNARRTIVIEKAGSLTATGSSLTSMFAISELKKADLILNVDSMQDAADAAFVFSSVKKESSIQLPGAGAGFEGKIASGTNGEAMTIREILELFLEERPNGNLKNAVLFFSLTRPVSLPASLSLSESFYDFKDNQAMIKLLVKCNDEYSEFIAQVEKQKQIVSEKIAEFSSGNSKLAESYLKFLSQKAKSIFETKAERIISESRKVDKIKIEEDILKFSKELGYEEFNNPYLQTERFLGIRENFFFGSLKSLIKVMNSIDTITESDLETINQIINFCLERIFI